VYENPGGAPPTRYRRPWSQCSFFSAKLSEDNTCQDKKIGLISLGGQIIFQGGLRPFLASGWLRPWLQYFTQVTDVLPWRYDAELGTANSLHASA